MTSRTPSEIGEGGEKDDDLENLRKRIIKKHFENFETGETPKVPEPGANRVDDPERYKHEDDELEQLRTRIKEKYGPEVKRLESEAVGGNRLAEDYGADLDDPESSDGEGMVRKASAYMDSFALLVPERIIPEHDDRDDVFAVRLERELKPGEEYTLYMTHLPGYDRAYLNIKQLDAQEGEKFRIKSVDRFQEGSFAKNYNDDKPKGLENTELAWKDGRLTMKVDYAEFELKDLKLRAQEGKAVLDAKLNDEEKNSVKIASGIDGMDFRFNKDHASVTSMREGKEGIIATYMRTHDDVPPHKRLIEFPHQERRELEEWKHEVKLDIEGLVTTKRLERERDEIAITLSEENRMNAANYYASTELTGEERWHQADIGEEVARLVLERSGFKTVIEHTDPQDDRVAQHNSELHGMDRVVEREGKYYAVSVKHWLDPEKALRNAKNDAERFARDPKKLKLEQKLKVKFEGGIAIEVFWSYRDLKAVIYTDYVEY